MTELLPLKVYPYTLNYALECVFVFSDGLRRLFCLLSMQQQEDEKSLMEVLLLADTQLWKSKNSFLLLLVVLLNVNLQSKGMLYDSVCLHLHVWIRSNTFGQG